jgi:hypothetical protein
MNLAALDLHPTRLVFPAEAETGPLPPGLYGPQL